MPVFWILSFPRFMFRREAGIMSRPKVVIFGGASVDGRLTIAPGVLLMFGDKRWDSIAGSDEEIANWLREKHKPQAYLEGSGSLVASTEKFKPLPKFKGRLEKLYQDFLPESIVRRPNHRGWFCTVDSKGLIRWVYKEFPSEDWKGWHLMVIVANHTPPEYLAYLQKENIPYLVAGKERVNLNLALEKMKSQLGITSVMSTSPGKLGGALLRAGLVDEVNIMVLPSIIGGFKTPSLFQSPELKPDEWPTRLRLIWAQVQSDSRVWLRYEISFEKKPFRKRIVKIHKQH
jgi:2,5-diamino-6-(ribosylamino)-4(3H)-pyrimidinone 5'-phosphate reductase